MPAKIKKIGVLCYYSFPEGMAPTTRIIAYTKGLLQNGVNAEVIVFRPRIIGSSFPPSGKVQGVNYCYPYSRKSDVSKLRKIIIERPLSIVHTICYICKSHKQQSYDYILISFDNLRYMIPFIPILRLLGIKLAFIGDEYPIPIREKLKESLPLWRIILYKIVFTGISIRILMTQALEEFFNTKISSKPTHILSTIVDISRFENVAGISKRDSKSDSYICYMGNMELSKDNVDNIILAFKNYLDTHSANLKLRLYGNPSVKDKQKLASLVSGLNLENKVLFMGKAEYKEVPGILAGATILVTSQPLTKRAEGGFPTKLGEYMLSGVPTIVTDVGEISNYVKDGENAYIVNACDPIAYSDKIDYVLTHYEEALEVAKQGRIYIESNFSCQNVTKELITFLENN